VKRKLLSLFLSLCLLLPLAACGEVKPPAAESSSYIMEQFSELPEEITGISRAALDGERILLCCREDNGETSQSYAAVLPRSGGTPERLPLDMPPDAQLTDLVPDEQGGLWCLAESPRGEAAASSSLCHFDSGGALLSTVELDELFAANGLSSPYAQRQLAADGEGKLCVTVSWGSNTCFLFDPAGNFQFSLRDSGGSALPVIRLADGRLALCSSNDGGWHYRLQPIAWESKDFGNAISLGTTTRVFDGAGEDSFYLYDSSALYAYGTDGGERRAIFRWSELGLAGGDAFVLPLGEGRFAILASVFSQTGCGSYEYCLVAPGEDTRTVLHMTSLQPDTTILEAIAQFNKRSSDYRVELRAFFSQAEDVSEADWRNALTKLSTELIAGNVPDLLDLDDLPIDALLRQGLLEDLYPWLRADETLCAADFFDSVFAAMSIEGQLPCVTTNVMLLTVFVDPAAVNGAERWTLEDFAAFREAGLSVESVSPGWFLSRLLAMENPYVDWAQGSCAFDSPAFISLLELCKSLEGEESTWILPDGTAQNPAACLFVNAASVFDVALYRAFFGGNPDPIGYPGQTGSLHALRPLNRIGMAAAGGHKDGAWAFVRSFLEPRAQESGAFLPIRRDSFDKIARAAAEGHSMWAMQSYYGQLTDEDIALTRKLLNDAACALSPGDGLSELIDAGASAFFRGDKTAEEAAREIQMKAALYVGEHQ